MESKATHLIYVPFTGLGNHKGFRGNTWLKNRIQLFKQFVIPSLQAQTEKDFILWISWRPEEKSNPQVKALMHYLSTGSGLRTIHTFSGVCFYDDKHEDAVARDRLLTAIHGSMGALGELLADSDYVYMTIQPSDDLYEKDAVKTIHYLFEHENYQAVGFKKGYIMNYWTKEIAEYNPTTNPPFYTIKFPKEIFIKPLEHAQYTSLKKDVGKYKVGTPLPSHEYVGDCLNYYQIDERGFMVGTHLENISTTWQIPFKGELVPATDKNKVLENFGILGVADLDMKVSTRKKIYFALPYKAQRKIRYWLTEKFKVKNPLKKLFFWRNYTTKQHERWWKNRKIDWRKDYLSTWNHPHRQVLRQFLERMNWMSLMEIGCGAGANLVQIATKVKNRRYQLGGTDINPDAIEVANTNGYFKGGSFFVCPNDDIMMSDKSTDITLSDMNLIYTGSRNIDKTLQEMKRITRNWIVLCEFDSTDPWQRFKTFILNGYHVYDYKKLLEKNGFYDIMKYKLMPEHWPESKTQQQFAHIIMAKVPKY